MLTQRPAAGTPPAAAQPCRRARISWWGLLLSQVALIVGMWLSRHWGIGFWWTLAWMTYAAGYAVVYVHPPVKEPLTYLALVYGLWLLGMVVDRWVIPRF